MFPSETNKKISKLFTDFGKYEMKINDSLLTLRQSICFNPLKLFNYLDKDKNDFITNYDLLSYFQ